MPSISSLQAADLSELTPVQQIPTIEPIQKSDRNMFHRCPVPQITHTTSDTISQANLHGLLPQHRVFLKG